MAQIWLRPNKRILMVGLSIPLLVLLLGGASMILAWRWQAATGWWIAAGLLMLLGGYASTGLVFSMLTPRLGYDRGDLVVILDSKPTRVPLELVEGVFLGESKADEHLTGDQPAKSKNLIVRLSQPDHRWKQIDVKPALGNWEHGYITCHGAWCEPLSVDVASRINKLLADAKQELQQDGETKT
jgi:hypothetical protein